MKTPTLMIKASLLIATAVIAIGCAKENKGGEPAGVNNPQVVPTPTPDPTPTPTPTPITDIGDPFANATGGHAEFTPVDLATFNTYVALHPVNAPKGFKVSVDLQNVGGDSASNQNPSVPRWAGYVKIAYFDNGSWYVATFESGFNTNQVSYKDRTTGRKEATFNHWYHLNNKEVFHGFFQDQHGAVILVVDGVGGDDNGDGQVPTDLKGSIYFKNFPTSMATQSPEKCWFIRIGPYDCRSFLLNNSSDRSERDIWSFSDPVTPSASDGYRKLGTFTGLNKDKAFHQ